MKMQMSTPAIKMNTLQISLKKAFGLGVNFLTRNLLKAVPIHPNGTEILPLVNVISNGSCPKLPEPKNSKKSNNTQTLLSFEEGLNGIDADLYTPFMMHMEGYRDCEIADYLSLSENQVALTISKVRDFLQTHHSSAIN